MYLLLNFYTHYATQTRITAKIELHFLVYLCNINQGKKPSRSAQYASGKGQNKDKIAPRDTHAQFSRDLLDAQWLVEVSTESPDRSGDVRGVAPLDRQVTEPGSLLSSQEPVDHFPRDQRQEDRRVGRGVQEPREPHDGVQQMHIQRADGDGPHISMISRRGVTGLHHDRADEGGGEFQAQTEVGPFLRCFQDLADAGQLDSSEQVMRGVVPVAAVTEKDLFAALGNHAHGWLEYAVKRL